MIIDGSVQGQSTLAQSIADIRQHGMSLSIATGHLELLQVQLPLSSQILQSRPFTAQLSAPSVKSYDCVTDGGPVVTTG